MNVPTAKLLEYLMIIIIVLMLMNYADYVELEPKLVMLMFSIALYVMFKCSTTSSKVEGLDGGSVAFDKDAFTNLNKLVSALVNNEETRIPGNLVVDGTITVKDTNNKGNNITGATTIKGVTTFENDAIMNGGKHFYHKSDSASVYGDGEDKADGNDGKICYTTEWGGRGLHIVGIKNGNEGRIVRFHTQSNYTGHVKTNTIAVDSWITVGTDENAKMQIRQARIGNKRAGDIEFGNGGDNWKRCFNYNTSDYNRGIASGEFWCSGRINTHTIYTHVIDTDQLKGHAWGGPNINLLGGINLRTGSGNERVEIKEGEVNINGRTIGLHPVGDVKFTSGKLRFTTRSGQPIVIENKDGYEALIYESEAGYIKVHPYSGGWWNR